MKEINSKELPSFLPNNESVILIKVLITSIFFHSLNPPILYVSKIFPL